MPFICKTKRQTDYNLKPSSCPIVIDNGASYFRIGWAGESEPWIIFRNIVQRPRHKITGETVTVVGDHDPALLRYFDCTRSGPRLAFENDVVYQFEIIEYDVLRSCELSDMTRWKKIFIGSFHYSRQIDDYQKKRYPKKSPCPVIQYAHSNKSLALVNPTFKQ